MLPGKLPCLLLFLLLGVLMTPMLSAQRIDRARSKLNEHRTESWPPEKVYARISLGRALQETFQRHYQYCGFDAAEGSRDYLPADITRFLGSRDLRTKVEEADLSGGGLLQYIFSEDETAMPLNVIRFQPDHRLELPGVTSSFELSPAEEFDTFVLTENCSGYLKAALDAGVEPPYSAFRAALNTDDRKESTVLAIAGTFLSPLETALLAKDARTTSLMLRLWEFYQLHPEYIGQAYYLKSFAGIMIKHTASAEESRRIENELGMNVNAPLGIKANAQVDWGRSRRASFSGTDWETIVYADFNEKYTRQQWYARLPDPNAIMTYFAQLQPAVEKHAEFPLLTEGVEHRHYLTLEGIPASLARGGWVIEAVSPGVYAQAPRLEARPFSEDGRFGCRFTIMGEPIRTLFSGPLAERPGKQSLSFQIRSLQQIGNATLKLSVKEELPTSAHPVVQFGQGRFDLSIKEDRRFALQWKVPLEITDKENPVDFLEIPYFSAITLRGSDQLDPIEVQVKEVVTDVRRHEYVLILETVQTWPLGRINDQEMKSYQLSCQVHLPAERSEARMQRPLQGVISFPKINPPPPPPTVQGVDLSPTPVILEGGGNKED